LDAQDAQDARLKIMVDLVLYIRLIDALKASIMKGAYAWRGRSQSKQPSLYL
jgi:hypothetical protein